MTFSNIQKSSIEITNNLSTTTAIPFGQDAIIIVPSVNFGNTTFYGSVDGENYYPLKDSSNASLVRSMSANTMHSVQDAELWGVPFLKLVSTAGGKAKVSIVQGGT